jgi:hypothetical protein
MLAAIWMEPGPDILMITIPPEPAGEATAAMVESNMATTIQPPLKRMVPAAEADQSMNHPNFFWV